jgi:hypothetical protein
MGFLTMEISAVQLGGVGEGEGDVLGVGFPPECPQRFAEG